jgi:tetratricopeptide (TPR) repeat protein
MRSILAALTCAAFAITLSPGAHALPQRKPDKSASKLDPKVVEAKKLFEEGADSYTQGNYEVAIAAWEKSYEISKRPLIFESIANAYERLGNPRKAREYLARWREVAPAEEHSILDARLKNLEARITREDEQQAAFKAKADAEKEKEEEKEKLLMEQMERKAEPKPSSFSVPGLALTGAGGVAVIVGVTLDIVASQNRPDSKACAVDKEAQICLSSARDQISSSNTLATVGDILWITGAAATAAGLALIFTYKAKEKPAAPAIQIIFAPTVAPQRAGLLFQHRF